MNFIKKIFEGKTDNLVHKQFKRFGKGVYENRAVVEVKKSKSSVKVKTSFEFAEDFARFLANTVKDKAKVSGGIITKKDIRKELNFDVQMKQFAGVKTFLIDNEIDKDSLNNIFNKFSDALFLLSFATDYGTLKVKVKSPKAAKPGKDNEVKADFCTFTAKDLNFIKEFAFDVNENFSELKINHTFTINELIVSDKDMDNPAMARENALRKGKIKRMLNIDGKIIEKEINFEA
ncbi:hypothetical protein HYX16_06250 [Candidatus Woesearchaeota archaeon]|nr:hypothetical protein [Candidatus Woesearchaeota archaeon]